MSTPNTSFSFEISLTVLNHLGRQLYRNFITIHPLGRDYF